MGEAGMSHASSLPAPAITWTRSAHIAGKLCPLGRRLIGGSAGQEIARIAEFRHAGLELVLGVAVRMFTRYGRSWKGFWNPGK